MTPREYFDTQPPVDYEAYTAAINEAVTARMAANPDLPQLTAISMASDAATEPVAEAMLRAGVPFDDALVFVGSYSKLEWCIRMIDAGLVDRDRVLDALPDMWPMADPDDTDPRFLRLWHAAWLRNGRRTIYDGPPIPAHVRVSLPMVGEGRKFLKVYRGQGENDRAGIAWSLDEKVALRFANGAGNRVPGSVKDATVFFAHVHIRHVMAYLTQRGEAEVIVSPANLR